MFKYVYSGSGDFDIVDERGNEVAMVFGDWSHMHSDPKMAARADRTEAIAKLLTDALNKWDAA